MNRQIANVITHLKKDLNVFCYYDIQKFNLSTGLVPFLVHIGDNKKASPSDMVKSLCMDPAHVARSVNKLVKLELVQEIENVNKDKRKKIFELTNKGRQAYVVVVEAMLKWEGDVLASLEEEEKITLISLLNKINKQDN